MAEPALHFEVNRADLHECRVVAGDVPDVDEGQTLLRVDAFGFTANNITYAVFGEAMKYWEFFPASGEWGRIPVWGFADTVASNHERVAEGSRFYGYLPMATHLVVTPGRVDEQGFVDVAPHRAGLPSAYNRYQHAGAGPIADPEREAHRMLLWPLFFTSFLLDDYLADADFWGAGTIVMSSASSKTSIGTAFLLADRGDIEVVGLTSAASVDFVESLGIYGRVLTYDAVTSIPSQPAVYVDLAGNGELRGAVHDHYGDDLASSVLVGGTHWDQSQPASGGLPGPRPSFFFAPDQIRTHARGPDRNALDGKMGAAWKRFVKWTDGWFTVTHHRGPEAVERVYVEQLDGRTESATGPILSLWS